MTSPDTAALEGGRRSRRLPALDIARGVAVVAMVIYHTGWDLSALALADLDVSGSRSWQLFARSIAASFLLLAGISLVVAHGEGIRWAAFWRRLGVIAAASLAITVATWFAFPQAYIFFGILQNMAVSSLIALPFLLTPALVAAAAAALFIALPFIVSGGVFDAPWLAILGLGRIPPLTYDWVPILPWTGYLLAGVAIGRLVAETLPRHEGGRLGRGLALLGRYSLVIYLLHQPLIFGALLGVRTVFGPNPVAEAAPFMRNCTRSCQDTGQSEILCRTACACTVAALRRDGIWAPIAAGQASEEFLQRAGNRAGECLKQAQNPPQSPRQP